MGVGEDCEFNCIPGCEGLRGPMVITLDSGA